MSYEAMPGPTDLSAAVAFIAKRGIVLESALRRHQDVLVCRLIDGKVTYVHRRLWPAVYRLRRTLGSTRVAAIQEIHGATGAHHVLSTMLGRWLPAKTRDCSSSLTLENARRELTAAGVIL